jgi:hypothetical protein
MKISIGVMTCYKFKERYDAIKNTWGKDFDRIIYFGGDQSDPDEIIPLNYPEKYGSILYIQHDIYKYLYEKHKDSDWYCVINDDSILFKDNLENRLSMWNPQEDLYVGTSNYKSDILPFRNYLKNPRSEFYDMYYASGGPGFFLSNSLMNKIYPVVDEMLNLWINDFDTYFKEPLLPQFIDIGLAYQLYKMFNIKVTDINTEEYRLYTGAPFSYNGRESICKYPMGFHYIQAPEMYKLYSQK